MDVFCRSRSGGVAPTWRGPVTRGGSTAASQSQLPEPRDRKEMRRERREQRLVERLPPLFLRRTDLWPEPGPWAQVQHCTVVELQLEKQTQALQQGCAADVNVELKVERARGIEGYYLAGTVESDLPLRCEWCGAPQERHVEVQFRLWLNCETGGDDALLSEAEERWLGPVADLSPTVADAILSQLPTVFTCSTTTCAEKQALSATPPSRLDPAASPFAKLLQAAEAAQQ